MRKLGRLFAREQLPDTLGKRAPFFVDQTTRRTRDGIRFRLIKLRGASFENDLLLVRAAQREPPQANTRDDDGDKKDPDASFHQASRRLSRCLARHYLRVARENAVASRPQPAGPWLSPSDSSDICPRNSRIASTSAALSPAVRSHRGLAPPLRACGSLPQPPGPGEEAEPLHSWPLVAGATPPRPSISLRRTAGPPFPLRAGSARRCIRGPPPAERSSPISS